MKFTQLSATPGFPSSTAKIERLGSISITINAGALNAVGVVTLSPALPDSVLGNYLAFASVDDVAAAWSGRARIASTTSLQILVSRGLGSTLTSSVAGGPTDLANNPEYPSDTQIDVGAGHQHQTDSLGNTNHTHTITSAHNHAVSYAAAVTMKVDWMIIHI